MINTKKYISSANTSTPSFVKKEFDKSTVANTNYDAYLFVIGEGKRMRWISGKSNSHIRDVYCILENFQTKEALLLKAVENLIKKSEFLQLSMQMESNYISEDDFFQELEDNESKYLISIDEEFKPENFKFISHIMSKLGRDFSSDEISEIFSVSLDLVNDYIDDYLKKVGK